jgi:WD40 repeat protein
VATAGGKRVLVWDAASGKVLQTLEHENAVTAIDFSPDGAFVLTTSGDKRARVWRVETGQVVARTVAHPTALVGGSFNPSGKLFVTFDAGPERIARVFRANDAEQVASLEQQGVVVGAWWDPTGRVLLTGGRRNGYLWSTQTWERLQLLEGHTRPIDDAAFSPDGERVVTVGDHVGRMWRVSDGKILLTMPGSEHELAAVAFKPDGNAVLTGGKDGVGRIWAETGNGKPAVAYGGHRDTVDHVGYSPDGKFAMTASVDGTARLWDPSGDPELRAIGSHGAPAPVASAAFSPDGKLILSAGACIKGAVAYSCGDGTARLWRWNGTTVASFAHGGHVTRALLLARATIVVTAGDDGTAKVWRVRDRALLATLPHGAPIRALAAASDGHVIITAGDDGDARVWTQRGRLLRTLHHGGSLVAVALGAKATRAVTGGTDGNAIVWNVTTGERVRVLPDHEDGVTAVAFDRTGVHVATGAGNGDAQLWNLKTEKMFLLERTPEALGVTTVRFSPQGDLVLTADEDGDVRTWKTRTGKLDRLFKRHVSVVADASFSGDGKWIVTAGPSAAGIWQTRTGKLLFFYRGHTAPLTTAAFAPGGRRFVTAAQDGTLRAGVCDVCTGIRDLTQMARRRLAQIERPDRPR